MATSTKGYYFAPDPRWSGSCGQLLQRIQNQEITGYTSAAILSETAHRIVGERKLFFAHREQDRHLGTETEILRALTDIKLESGFALAGLTRS